MATARKYLSIDEKEKELILDTLATPNPGDELTIKMMKEEGYKIKVKKVIKDKETKKKKTVQLTAKDIREKLKNDKEALDMFNAIIGSDSEGKITEEKRKEYNGKKGFFAAKSFYKDYLNGKAKK